ncbi:MAG: hypothetical protein JWQ19_3407, partial [Subtercola sp.]|nr:hypothetical protein [Subtercola sp.]
MTAEGMAQSYSGDGQFTVFESDQDLTPDAVGTQRHVYRQSAADGSLVLVSKQLRTPTPGGSSYGASISFDGRWVAFQTTDGSVFSEDPTPVGSLQIALVDMSSGGVTLVSAPKGTVPTPPAAADGTDLDAALPVNENAMVSSDGSHVVFSSSQPGMSNKGAPTGTTLAVEQFDRRTGDITNVSSGVNATSGAAETANGTSDEAAVSSDGRYVAYSSAATDLGVAATDSPSPDAADPRSYVYRWDAQTGKSMLISQASSDSATGTTAIDDSSYGPSISYDGSRVGFISGGTNLLDATDYPKSANHMTDAYVRDLTDPSTDVTHRVSLVMVDEAQPSTPDSHGFNPSVTRTRRWFEPWVSTTRISLSGDGRSAVLTSMSPLAEIHGDCVGCQTFDDSNSALDVFDVLLTPDARPEYVQPISVKRTNQDPLNPTVQVMLRQSTTGDGDSSADGRTPVSADGTLVAYASQAGDLRGFTSIKQIQLGGPPAFLTPAWLPIYTDGGEPDGFGGAVRTFTTAADAFNLHLYVSPQTQAKFAAHPFVPVEYETRLIPLPTLTAAPIHSATATSFLSPATISPGTSNIVYGLTVRAGSTGSAEVVIDFDQLSLTAETSIPAGWVRAPSDTAGTVTYTDTLLNAGDLSTFSLRLTNTNTDLNATSASVTASVNGIFTTSTASIDIKPKPAACVTPADSMTAIAGNSTALLEVQCTASARSTLAAHADHGSVAVSASGTFTYTPNVDYHGPDTIQVASVDAYLRSSTPTLIPLTVAARPVATDDSYSTAVGATLAVAASAGALSNDVLSTDPSQWQIQQGYPPPNGTLVMDDHTGAFTFTPA